jgi:hypothetical protein
MNPIMFRVDLRGLNDCQKDVVLNSLRMNPNYVTVLSLDVAGVWIEISQVQL